MDFQCFQVRQRTPKSAEASMASGRVDADLYDLKHSYPPNPQIPGMVYPPIISPSAPAHTVVHVLERGRAPKTPPRGLRGLTQIDF